MTTPRIIDGRWYCDEVAKKVLSGPNLTDTIDEANAELTAAGKAYQLEYPREVRIGSKPIYPELRENSPTITIVSTDTQDRTRAANKAGFLRHTLTVTHVVAHHPSDEEDLVQVSKAYAAAIKVALVDYMIGCSEGAIYDVLRRNYVTSIYTFRGQRAYAMIGTQIFTVEMLGRA